MGLVGHSHAGHLHHHHHGHVHSDNTGRVLSWSLALTVGFVVLEVVFGFRAGSLALLSDAGHNFTDALAIALAGFGVYAQAKPANERKTYGYHRAGVLAAFVNALTLLGLSGFIFWESVQRLRNPEPVQETIMIAVAGVGLLVNVAIMAGLHSKRDDLNIRAAWVHMLGDALGSVAIIIGALGIRYTGWAVIDPVLSILIGLLIIWSAKDIIVESLDILLEALPAGVNFQQVATAVKGVEGVIDVHDLHIWSLGSNNRALSCHVLIEDQPHSSSEVILKAINQVLHQRFDIHHTTVQLEHARCAVSQNGCSAQGTICCD